MNGRHALSRGQSLPKFFAPGRRRDIAALVGTALAVAVLSATTARMVPLLSQGHNQAGVLLLVAGLLALIAGTAGLRVFERRLAEKLGQDYVHQIRKELIRAALAPGRNPSLGITIARTSNDLNSVRNWVTFGIAGAVSGVPLIIALTVALWLMAPPLALAVMGPLLGVIALLAFLSKPTFERARALRQRRGRLAGQITDTINAATAVRAAGGEERELTRVDKLGREVATAAVRRATLAGYLRASAIGAASAAAVSVAATSAFTPGLDRGVVAAALTVVGMIAGPVHDLGRIVEHRQSYRAACRSIAPALPRRSNWTPAADSATESTGGLVIAGLDAGGNLMPQLAAAPGETVLLATPDHTLSDEVFHALLGLRPGTHAALDGRPLNAMGPSQRRRYVGYAARGLPLESGQFRRAIRYRVPATDDVELAEAIVRAGLEATVARLPKGDRTVLRRGGEPLSTPERAKLQLARATLGNPPLLLLNRIDADLDVEGLAALRQIIANYPGIVIVATENPSILPESHRNWPAG